MATDIGMGTPSGPGDPGGDAPAATLGVPSPWVARFLPGVRRDGVVLDVACGSGRHLRLARARGHAVLGVDRTLEGVWDLIGAEGVELLQSDLERGEPWPLGPRVFAAVIVTNYLWRAMLPDIVAAVAADGLLVYETFARGHERLGRPRRPDFLLEPGELLAAVAGRLVPIAYEHVTLHDPPRRVQRLAAVGRDHDWLITPPGPIPDADGTVS